MKGDFENSPREQITNPQIEVSREAESDLTAQEEQLERPSFDDIKRSLGFDGQVRNGRAMCHCPAHDDSNPSLSLKQEDGKILWHCFSGCSQESVRDALIDRGLWSEKIEHEEAPDPGSSRCIAVYDYRNANGEPVMQSLRYLKADGKKTFSQRVMMPDGSWNDDVAHSGVERVVYNLPAILAEHDRFVFWVEGEKDVDNATKAGLLATTSIGGSNAFHLGRYPDQLRGRHVGVVADNDESGRQYARTVANALLGVAASVRVIELSGLPYKGDLSDWLEAGGTKDGLAEIAKQTPHWRPVAPEGYITPTPVHELLAEPDAEYAWVVAKLLLSGGTSLLVAPPKTGKSTLVQNIVVAVSQGEMVLNMATRRGPVIYLAFEENRDQLKKRLRAIGPHDSSELHAFTGQFPKDGIGNLTWLVDQYKPVLVVADTLQRLLHLDDLNNYAVVSNALEPFMQLARQKQFHLMLTHHASKEGGRHGKGVLGSTAIYGTVDTLTELWIDEESPGERRYMKATHRYGDRFYARALVMDGEYRLKLEGSRRDMERREQEESVLSFLAEQSGKATHSEILGHVRGVASVKTEAIERLVRDGVVEIVNGPRHGGGVLTYATKG